MISNRIVITGAPGTGKTTIIEALKNKGYTCFDEISREIISKYQEEGIADPFKTHSNQFSIRLLKGRIQQYEDASQVNQKTIFYDRGIPDIIAYLNYSQSTIPLHYKETTRHFSYTTIFITPPWEAIYTNDSERFESFEQAKQIHQHLTETYNSLGYSPIEIPLSTVARRVSFILKSI